MTVPDGPSNNHFHTLYRRKFLHVAGVSTPVILSGCGGSSSGSTPPKTPESPIIRLAPKNPKVGEKTVLKANTKWIGRNYDGTVYYVWSLNNNWKANKVGGEVLYRFDEKGTNLIRLLAVVDKVFDQNFDIGSPKNIDDILEITNNIDNDDRWAIYNKRVNIEPLEEAVLRVKNGELNILLKGNKRNVPINDEAILQFSISNLTSNNSLEVDLVIEMPTGTSIKGTSFQQGGGQYVSNYKVKPGEVKGDSIQVQANSPGTYKIQSRAVYNFLDTPNNRDSASQSITVRFYK